MKPYTLKLETKYVVNLFESLFVSLIVFLSLLAVPYYIMPIIVILAIICFIWFVHSLYKYIKFKRESINYEVLVISKNGVEFGDENEITNIAWDDISEIFIQRKGYSRNVWAELVFCLRTGDKCIFSLENYMPAINMFRIRKSLIFFSKRKDIISKSCNLWLLL